MEKVYKYTEESKNWRNIFSQNKILFIAVGTNLYGSKKTGHNNGTVMFLAIHPIDKIPWTPQPTKKLNSNSAQSNSNKNKKEWLRSFTLYSFSMWGKFYITCKWSTDSNS